jgi:hypothetical protein
VNGVRGDAKPGFLGIRWCDCDEAQGMMRAAMTDQLGVNKAMKRVGDGWRAVQGALDDTGYGA